MAIRCEDVTARLLELLYDELPEGERAAYRAHVDGCARCKAELGAFEQTRAVARQVLDEPVPARARAAILQAAAAHAAAAKPRVAAAAAPAAPPARKSSAESQPSFWERLRGRWAFPTLATVGAIAVFLIASKFLLEPNKAYQRGKETLRPTAVTSAPEAPHVASATEAPAPEPAAAEPELHGTKTGSAGPPPAARWNDGEGKAERRSDEAAPAARHKATAAPADSESDAIDRKYRHVTLDQSLASKSSNKKGKAPATAAKERPTGAAAGGGVGSLSGAGSVRGGGTAQGVGGVSSRGATVDDLLDNAVGGKRRFAQPPPARAPAPTAPAKRAISDSSDSALEGLGEPSAPRRAARDEAAAADSEMAEEESEQPLEKHVQAKAKKSAGDDKAEKKAEERKPAPPAPAPPPVIVSAPTSAQSAPAAKPAAAKAPDPLVQRADQLYAQGQWAEAAAVYRQLINRDPRNSDAPRWRQRLVVAERQNEAVQAARAAKAKAAPAEAPASASPPR